MCNPRRRCQKSSSKVSKDMVSPFSYARVVIAMWTSYFTIVQKKTFLLYVSPYARLVSRSIVDGSELDSIGIAEIIICANHSWAKSIRSHARLFIDYRL